MPHIWGDEGDPSVFGGSARGAASAACRHRSARSGGSSIVTASRCSSLSSKRCCAKPPNARSRHCGPESASCSTNSPATNAAIISLMPATSDRKCSNWAGQPAGRPYPQNVWLGALGAEHVGRKSEAHPAALLHYGLSIFPGGRRFGLHPAARRSAPTREATRYATVFSPGLALCTGRKHTHIAALAVSPSRVQWAVALDGDLAFALPHRVGVMPCPHVQPRRALLVRGFVSARGPWSPGMTGGGPLCPDEMWRGSIG